MILTYNDSGILFAITRGQRPQADSATAILDDHNLLFVSSAYVWLEVMPKSLFFQRLDETAFYEAYFQRVSVWGDQLGDTIQHARRLAPLYGLSAIDALHIASAL